MRTLRDWAEDHWAGLGVTISIAGALTLAVVIAVVFNVVATHAERTHHDSAQLAPPFADALTPLTRG